MTPKIDFAKALKRFPAILVAGEPGRRNGYWNFLGVEKKDGIVIFFEDAKAVGVEYGNVHKIVRKKYKGYYGYGFPCSDNFEDNASYAVIFDDTPPPVYQDATKSELMLRIQLQINSNAKKRHNDKIRSGTTN